MNPDLLLVILGKRVTNPVFRLLLAFSTERRQLVWEEGSEVRMEPPQLNSHPHTRKDGGKFQPQNMKMCKEVYSPHWDRR